MKGSDDVDRAGPRTARSRARPAAPLRPRPAGAQLRDRSRADAARGTAARCCSTSCGRDWAWLDVRHPLYNPGGSPLGPDTSLPFQRDADVVSLFSVITHQDPAGSRAIFTMLRRHVKDDGALFFTCFLDDATDTFADRSREWNLGRCFYDPTLLVALVEACGWRFVDRAPGEGSLFGDSFVFRPAP